ncbi:MAG TPA: hypothetical protein VM266_07005 [Solirubrobacteraceae bacterium]|nr:hypothetical protein [Solirubrobacteraceae bacterium]
MGRVFVGVWLVMVVSATAWVASVFAGSSDLDRRENMALVANYPGERLPGGGFERYRTGTDMAFWGDLAVLGNLDQGTGPNAEPNGGFRLMDISEPARPRLITRWKCPGDQSDVSIWKDLVILSADKPTKERCGAAEPASWEGIRVVSIKDPADPRIVATVPTRCGSHTNTTIRDGGRLLVYVLSYPLAGRYNPADKMVPRAAGGPGCNAVDHGVISVVEVPLSNPSAARVVSTPSVAPTIGCHDVTVFEGRELAAAACLTETQIWDLSGDPARPEVIAHIENPPGLNLSHSTAFSNDGRTLVVGDELGGAAASPGCVTDDKRYVSGGLFFFDVAGARSRAPRLVGNYKLPQAQASLFCTAHQFNVVPLRSDRDVLVSSWYTGATSVLDFTNPADPRQIAWYVPRNPTTPDRQESHAATWASYWYRGHVYSSNFDEEVNSLVPYSRGLDVFRVDHAAVRGALDLPRLNPQVQEPLPQPPGRKRKARGR